MGIIGRIGPIGRIGRILPLGLLVFAAAPALAHDQWIDAADFYPAVGETVEVYLCSGHYFPESSYAVKDDVLEGLWVHRPESGPTAIQTQLQDKRRGGPLIVDAGGVYVLGMVLKRPRAKEPAFEGKALIVVNPATDDAALYRLGTGLEITPATPVSGLAVGGELPVTVSLDGKPVSASLTVVPAGGKTLYVKTDGAGTAVVPIRKTGKYLMSAGVGGRTCSLVFEVPGARGAHK